MYFQKYISDTLCGDSKCRYTFSFYMDAYVCVCLCVQLYVCPSSENIVLIRE